MNTGRKRGQNWGRRSSGVCNRRHRRVTLRLKQKPTYLNYYSIITLLTLLAVLDQASDISPHNTFRPREKEEKKYRRTRKNDKDAHKRLKTLQTDFKRCGCMWVWLWLWVGGCGARSFAYLRACERACMCARA